MNFKELDIAPNILRALEGEHYATPTPIQEQAIPPILKGRDLLGCAQTGTGKTAAFAVPILQMLDEEKVSGARRPIRALVLTPTRELAVQIYDSFRAYGKYLPIRSCVIYGGVSQNPQVEALRRGVDIVVATPGRLNDLTDQGYVHLKKAGILVLDEADRMLDMGFIQDVKKIIGQMPMQRQTLFFSATMPPEVGKLVDSLLRDPVRVAVTPPSSAVDAIEQSVYFVDKGNKRKLLVHLLHQHDISGALVFTRTKHGADRVARELQHAKIDARAIHGDKSQNARQAALNAFKRGDIRVLVATDIAARGIDIEELPCVVNYDLPNVPETYVHRIGRTGRAGLSGQAIAFCDFSEKPYLAAIEKLARRRIRVVDEHPCPMEEFFLPDAPPARPSRRSSQGTGQGHAQKRRAPAPYGRAYPRKG